MGVAPTRAGTHARDRLRGPHVASRSEIDWTEQNLQASVN
jgi:hypothetical protein